MTLSNSDKLSSEDMEEIFMLDEVDQVSDDFKLYYDKSGNFFALRVRTDENKLSFCLQAKSPAHVIAKAVQLIDAYLSEDKGREVFTPTFDNPNEE